MSGRLLTSGHLLTYTLALLLTSTTVSAAVQTLDSINDLKKVDFGDSVPKHSLLLLHWFASMIARWYILYNNDVIHLTFAPNQRDYGAHYYHNFEQILDPLPWGYRYYTIGNLNPGVSSSVRLPLYVICSPYRLMGYDVYNRDRIIIRVRDYDRTIDQVYITQHDGLAYDPAHTYRITNNLLREIRLFSTTTGRNQRRSLGEIRDHFGSNIADSQLRDLENTWGDLACVGLLLFIVITERRCPVRLRDPQTRPQAWQNDSSAEIGICCVMSVILILIVFVIVLSVGNKR